MLDLNTAILKHSMKNPPWYPVLNSVYNSKHKPELQVTLTIEGDGKTSMAMDRSGQMAENTALKLKMSDLSLNMHPCGRHYQLGSMEMEDQSLFTFTMILSDPKDLPSLTLQQRCFQFTYSFFGVKGTSKPFIPPLFPDECKSIKIQSSEQYMSIFMASEQTLEIKLCCESTCLGQGSLSLNPLVDIETFTVTVLLGIGDATIDVSVALEKSIGTREDQSSAIASKKPATENRKKLLQSTSNLLTKTQITPSAMVLSSDIGIAKKTEIPSYSSSISSSSSTASLSTSGTFRTHSTHLKKLSASNSKKIKTCLSSSSRVSYPQLSQVINGLPLDYNSKDEELGEELKSRNSHSIPSGIVRFFVQRATSWEKKRRKNMLSPMSSTTDLMEGVNCFRLTVDVLSLKDIALTEGRDYYLRYYCSFFGSPPYSVIVKPPVSLHKRGEELHFCHSSNSFEFNAVYEELACHGPLNVELWESCDESCDCIVGSAQVSLSEIFTQEMTPVESRRFRRKCLLKSTIRSSPAIQHQMVSSSLAKLSLSIALEGLGPAIDNTSSSSSSCCSYPTFRKQAMKNSTVVQKLPATGRTDTKSSVMMETKSEGHVPMRQSSVVNNMAACVSWTLREEAAAELKRWKLREMENFRLHLKTVELDHLSLLEQEWKQKEAHRDQRQGQAQNKYSAMEQEILVEERRNLQAQQKMLNLREIKISQEREKLSKEQCSLQECYKRSVSNFKRVYKQKLEDERLLSSDRQRKVDSLIKQIQSMKSVIRGTKDEFMNYQQAELSNTQLERQYLKKVESDYKISLDKEWEEKEAQWKELIKHSEEKYTKMKTEFQEKMFQEREKSSKDLLSMQEERDHCIITIRKKFEDKLKEERLKLSEVQHFVGSLKKKVSDEKLKMSINLSSLKKERDHSIKNLTSKYEKKLLEERKRSRELKLLLNLQKKEENQMGILEEDMKEVIRTLKLHKPSDANISMVKRLQDKHGKPPKQQNKEELLHKQQISLEAIPEEVVGTPDRNHEPHEDKISERPNATTDGTKLFDISKKKTHLDGSEMSTCTEYLTDNLELLNHGDPAITVKPEDLNDMMKLKDSEDTPKSSDHGGQEETLDHRSLEGILEHDSLVDTVKARSLSDMMEPKGNENLTNTDNLVSPMSILDPEMLQKPTTLKKKSEVESPLASGSSKNSLRPMGFGVTESRMLSRVRSAGRRMSLVSCGGKKSKLKSGILSKWMVKRKAEKKGKFVPDVWRRGTHVPDVWDEGKLTYLGDQSGVPSTSKRERLVSGGERRTTVETDINWKGTLVPRKGTLVPRRGTMLPQSGTLAYNAGRRSTFGTSVGRRSTLGTYVGSRMGSRMTLMSGVKQRSGATMLGMDMRETRLPDVERRGPLAPGLRRKGTMMSRGSEIDYRDSLIPDRRHTILELGGKKYMLGPGGQKILLAPYAQKHILDSRSRRNPHVPRTRPTLENEDWDADERYENGHTDYHPQSQFGSSHQLREDRSHINIPFRSSRILSEPLNYKDNLLQSRSLSQELFCPFHPDFKLREYNNAFTTQENIADRTSQRSVSHSSPL